MAVFPLGVLRVTGTLLVANLNLKLAGILRRCRLDSEAACDALGKSIPSINADLAEAAEVGGRNTRSIAGSEGGGRGIANSARYKS